MEIWNAGQQRGFVRDPLWEQPPSRLSRTNRLCSVVASTRSEQVRHQGWRLALQNTGQAEEACEVMLGNLTT